MNTKKENQERMKSPPKLITATNFMNNFFGNQLLGSSQCTPSLPFSFPFNPMNVNLIDVDPSRILNLLHQQTLLAEEALKYRGIFLSHKESVRYNPNLFEAFSKEQEMLLNNKRSSFVRQPINIQYPFTIQNLCKSNNNINNNNNNNNIPSKDPANEIINMKKNSFLKFNHNMSKRLDDTVHKSIVIDTPPPPPPSQHRLATDDNGDGDDDDDDDEENDQQRIKYSLDEMLHNKRNPNNNSMYIPGDIRFNPINSTTSIKPKDFSLKKDKQTMMMMMMMNKPTSTLTTYPSTSCSSSITSAITTTSTINNLLTTSVSPSSVCSSPIPLLSSMASTSSSSSSSSSSLSFASSSSTSSSTLSTSGSLLTLSSLSSTESVLSSSSLSSSSSSTTATSSPPPQPPQLQLSMSMPLSLPPPSQPLKPPPSTPPSSLHSMSSSMLLTPISESLLLQDSNIEEETKCVICNATFPSVWLLEQHAALQHANLGPMEEKPFICDQCGQSYRYRSAYVKHREQNHRARLPADKLFTCDVCGMQFRYLKSFKKHRLNHALERLHGKNERKTMNGITNIHNNNNNADSNNELVTSSNEMVTSDELAELHFKIKTELKEEEAEEDQDDTIDSPTNMCINDQQNNSLDTIMKPKTIGSINLTLNESSSILPSSQLFNRDNTHFILKQPQFMHTNEMESIPSSSSLAQNTIMTPTSLSNLINAERIPNDQTLGLNPQEASILNFLRVDAAEKQRERSRFACPFCGKCVRSKENLKLHVRKHTGERPFVCLFCGRAFGGKSDLTRHLRIHTGERPYHCEACGKCFARADYLSKHLTTHVHNSAPR